MEGNSISLMINSVCRDLGIDYKSTNPEVVTLYDDAQKLGKLYFIFKEAMGFLAEIEDRYDIDGLSNLLEDDIKSLYAIDHHLVRLAYQLKEKLKIERK